MRLSFEQLAEDITRGISNDGPAESEQLLLIEEVKIGGTFGMLQFLDREHRLAYILGEIMEFSGPEAAEVLDISPELFRKRLQLARTSLINFTRSCGGV
jgi:DNA-directed RNA polymerase specialized sigma24 family protein